MKTPLAVLATFLLLASASSPAAGESRREMQDVLVLRFENTAFLDAPDSDLAPFLVGIHRDGSFTPPLRTLIGPALHNPYFTGFAEDAWLEGVLAAPVRPGPCAWVWTFPVEHRDEYLAALVRQGLSDSESVDEVSVLTATAADGSVRRSYLEWLPGNIAVFGSDRDAVRAVRGIYESAAAARGLLGARRSLDSAPDAAVRFFPARLAAWQEDAAGVYWWRSQIMRLASEITGFWNPDPARGRLIASLSEDLAALPMDWRRCDFGVWFGETAVEWRADLDGGGSRAAPVSDLSTLRRMPEGVCEAYALALDVERVGFLFDRVGRLLLAAAGGAVPAGARAAAAAFAATLAQAGARQAAYAWLPPPPASPRLGSTRLLVAEWNRPELLDAAWLVFEAAANADGPVAAALAQIGWELALEPQVRTPGAYAVTLRPFGRDDEPPYLEASVAARRRGSLLALAWGSRGGDLEERERLLTLRGELAEQALAGSPDGSPDVRRAFTLMAPRGAALAVTFSPVRFLQAMLAEAADWRVLAPDEPEPASTRAAKEMFEYHDAGGAWCAVVDKPNGEWELNGRMSWESLRALAAALGVSEPDSVPDEGAYDVPER